MAASGGGRRGGAGGRGRSGVAGEERYARQLALPGLGVIGQERLAQTHVVVLGAGGLGFPVLTYLGAAGVGRISFIDADAVELSNLNRQALYTPAEVGQRKVSVALERLRNFAPEVNWAGTDAAITLERARGLLANAQLAVDCADNFSARRILAEAARQARVPLVHGAVAGFEGQVAVLPGEGPPCLLCLYPEGQGSQVPPPVLGAVAGVVGSLMACEAIRLLLALGPRRTGSVLLVDVERGTFDWLAIPARSDCPWCSPAVARPRS
ncbi:MAG: HesA/MoeB/ThiF family protein [Thermoanaerobaculaceae bacterium]|nr:HesA/MoeB/ThiF family protein [Thermoanaerobaculaceae bacterium]